MKNANIPKYIPHSNLLFSLRKKKKKKLFAFTAHNIDEMFIHTAGSVSHTPVHV